MSDVIVRKCHVYQAINEIKLELAKYGGITKDNQAPEKAGGYRFRGIDDMFNVLCGITAKYGIVMIPRVIGSPRVEFGQSKNGTAQTHVFLDMEVDYVSAIDGSMHTGKYAGEAIDTGDKASNKAMSAAFKYAHLYPFQIPTHGEEDTEAYVVQASKPTTQANGQRPTQAIRDESAAKQSTKELPRPEGTSPVSPPSLIDRVLGAKAFAELHETAREAHADKASDAVWNTIRERCRQMLMTAPAVEDLRAAKDLIKDLGSPKMLMEAANIRFAELNGRRSA